MCRVRRGDVIDETSKGGLQSCATWAVKPELDQEIQQEMMQVEQLRRIPRAL